MIFDNMKSMGLYYGCNSRFEAAAEFIKKAVAENYEVGKYVIDGDNLYASVQAYDTKPSAEGKYEGHHKYIDIQYIISGIEVMEVADIGKMTPKTDYNPEKDCEFYEDATLPARVIVQQGEYAIFFPHDIHKPGLAVDDTPAPVRKIVVKVKV